LSNTFRSVATATLVSITAAAIPAKSVGNIGGPCAPLRATMEALKADPSPDSQADAKFIKDILPSCGSLERSRAALTRSETKLDELMAIRRDIENFASNTSPAPQ
jgi:hypothetical protein